MYPIVYMAMLALIFFLPVTHMGMAKARKKKQQSKKNYRKRKQLTKAHKKLLRADRNLKKAYRKAGGKKKKPAQKQQKRRKSPSAIGNKRMTRADKKTGVTRSASRRNMGARRYLGSTPEEELNGAAGQTIRTDFQVAKNCQADLVVTIHTVYTGGAGPANATWWEVFDKMKVAVDDHVVLTGDDGNAFALVAPGIEATAWRDHPEIQIARPELIQEALTVILAQVEERELRIPLTRNCQTGVVSIVGETQGWANILAAGLVAVLDPNNSWIRLRIDQYDGVPYEDSLEIEATQETAQRVSAFDAAVVVTKCAAVAGAWQTRAQELANLRAASIGGKFLTTDMLEDHLEETDLNYQQHHTYNALAPAGGGALIREGYDDTVLVFFPSGSEGLDLRYAAQTDVTKVRIKLA